MLLDTLLPFEQSVVQGVGHADAVAENAWANQRAQSGDAWQVYRLDPLSESDIRLFANHRGIPEVDRLIVELQRANLVPMAARPFDLEGILVKWRSDRVLGGRLEMLQQNIAAGLKEIHPNGEQRRPLSHELDCHPAFEAGAVLAGGAGSRDP